MKDKPSLVRRQPQAEAGHVRQPDAPAGAHARWRGCFKRTWWEGASAQARAREVNKIKRIIREEVARQVQRDGRRLFA